MCDFHYVQQRYVALPSLDAANVGPVQLGPLGKLLLRKREPLPRLPHSLAEYDAGIGLHETDDPQIKTIILETISIKILTSRGSRCP